MSETFVIVGGDAAGMSAASKAKRERPEMDVIVFERGEWVSYAACGMPYYVKAFDLGATRTGVVDEQRAREAGFDPVSVTVSAPTRAHYYPGASELTVTLLADRETGTVLGGTLAGREGVKRVDTIATALHAGMTVTELQNADLAYAPPFSPVWDPVLTAAKVLEGKLDT